MASRRFRQELGEVLPDWQTRGLLAPGAAEVLRKEYGLDEKPRGLGGILLLSFGSALILGGIILLLGHNWDQLPVAVRLGCGLLPLVVTFALGARIVAADTAGTGMREAVGIANSLSVALAISITAQVYQISGDTPRFLMTWALLTLPAIFLLRSGLAWVCAQILFVSWAFSIERTYSPVPVYLSLSALAATVFLLPRWRAERQGTLATLALVGPAIWTIGIFACLERTHGVLWHYLVLSSWFGLVLGVAGLSPYRGAMLRRWLAGIGLSVLLIAMTFDDIWRRREFSLGWGIDGSATMEVVLITIIPLTLAIFLAKTWRRLHPTDLLWSACGFLGVPACILIVQGVPAHIGTIAFNLLCVVLSGLTMQRAVVELDKSRLNAGWLLLSALIITRFFDSDLSYLLRGLVFIGLGIGFLGLNLWLRRRTNA